MDLYSELIINRVMSPFYDSEAQGKIAVVLIDEDTLDAAEMGWPPSYDYYSQVVYRILRHNPKALFVDILLERERPAARDSLPSARQDLEEYAEDFSIPIFFAQSSPGEKNLFSGIPGVETAITGWNGNDYPLIVPVDSGKPDGKASQTVAMKLYQLDAPDTFNDVKVQDSPSLVVQWGNAVPALTRDKDLLPGSTYVFTDPTYLERWIKAFKLLKYSIFHGLNEDVFDVNRQQCPYTITMQAQDLADPDKRGMLEGKMVLLGANVDGVNDQVETPVHGLLPGVFQHAMALDNLMKYGSAYYTRPPFQAWIFISLAFVMSFFSSYLMVEREIRGLRVQVIAAAVVLIVCTVLYFVFRFAPQNWIGLLLVCSLANKLQSESKTPIG